MSSRYDELDRLQRLRESGTLSEEEFQAEKRRLLGHQSVAAEPETVEGAAPPRSRRPMWIGLALGALAVAVLAGLWFGNVVGGAGSGYESGDYAVPPENVATVETVAETPPVPSVHKLPPEEQLARAFEVAFGSRGEAVLAVASDGTTEDVRFSPGRLVWLPFGPVLISEGKVQDPAHVSAGRIAVHYLKPAGESFEVERAFPAAVVTGSSGEVASWSLNPRFSTWPVIAAQGGGTWQGQTCAWLTLTEIRPDGPAEIANVPLVYDDSSARPESGGRSIEGKVLNIVRNQSFDVVYSGSRAFSEHYVRGPKGYSVAGGKSLMQTC